MAAGGPSSAAPTPRVGDGQLSLDSPAGRFGQDGAYVVVRDGGTYAARARRVGARALLRPPGRAVAGIDHAECPSLMRLGAPTVSPTACSCAGWPSSRSGVTRLPWTASSPTTLGRSLAEGWHVRLEFLRRWSTLAALPGLPVRAGAWDQDERVVAVTLARMTDEACGGAPVPPSRHAGRAARAPPPGRRAGRRTTAAHDLDVIHVAQRARDGREGARALGRAGPRGHATAMAERERRDFHREFATYRFRPLSEHGTWQGGSGIVPASRD